MVGKPVKKMTASLYMRMVASKKFIAVSGGKKPEVTDLTGSDRGCSLEVYNKKFETVFSIELDKGSLVTDLRISHDFLFFKQMESGWGCLKLQDDMKKSLD